MFDNTELIRQQAKSFGRESLYAYVIGLITAITNNSYEGTAEDKIAEIKDVLQIRIEVINDKSLPWNYEQAQIKKTLSKRDKVAEKIYQEDHTTEMTCDAIVEREG